MELTDKNFEEVINSNKDKLIIIDFWAPWCKPCTVLSPILDQLQEELKEDIAVLKYNIDQEEKLVPVYNIRSIPTLVYIKNNEVISITSGSVTRHSLMECINKGLLNK